MKTNKLNIGLILNNTSNFTKTKQHETNFTKHTYCINTGFCFL